MTSTSVEFINDSVSVIEREDDNLVPNVSELVQDTTGCKARYILAFMGFLGFANVYAMRVNLSVAIVAMVNNSAIPQVNSTIITDTCPIEINNSTIPEADGEFDWDESTQGLILGCFFYGYVMTQIPGGRIAEMWGGKLVFGIGVLVTGILTALSPLAARISTPVFVTVRILEGLGEGVTFPSMHVMLSRWVPPLERSKFASYVYAGAYFGTVVSLPISGYLCSLEFLGGWPLSFYLFGIISALWFIAWMFLVYDTPQSHPRISCEEKNYIMVHVGSSSSIVPRAVPWKSILTCLPMWAILVTQCGQSWAFYTQLTELPTYMKNILHFDIEQYSLISALPYLACWLCGLGFSSLATWLLLHNYLSVLNSYKVFNSIGAVVPSLGLLAVAWWGCDRIAVTVLLVVSGGFSGATFAGNQMNHLSLSPQFSGTMYGITNAAANICGFLAPYAVGLLINGTETLQRWQIVFYIAAGINFVGNLFYILFASATEQPWSKDAVDKQVIKEDLGTAQ